MSIADEIVAISAGARFHRADLHIHSFGGSHDVADSGMTPRQIVVTAVAEGLTAIAIADHNEIKNVETGLTEAAGRSLLILPAVELSTPEGHLLVYFENLSDLRVFYGKLSFAGLGTADSRCQTAMLDCLKLIEPGKGFALLAHIDAGGGFEQNLAGYPPHKADILCHPNLLGIEVRDANSTATYALADSDPNRAAIAQKRINTLGLGTGQLLARVVFSDSHAVGALGRNAQGNRRVTRLKMDSPSFNGVRIALQDADARVRLEDEIPQSVPYLLGLKIEGGFLDGQTIHFSRNLNCIIGGRGAGKSTAFEAARFVSPARSASRLIDSDVWPQVLHLVWVDEAGEQHTIIRRLGEDKHSVDDPVSGVTAARLECYGQGETATTSAKAQADPSALLEYLDGFVDTSGPAAEESDVRDLLLGNQTAIEKAQLQVGRIPELRRLLATTRQQLQALEKAKAQEIVHLERKIAEERALRENIAQKVAEITRQSTHSAVRNLLKETETAARPEDLKVGASEFKAIQGFLSQFGEDTKAAEATLQAGAKALHSAVKKQLEQWGAREQQIATQIDTKRAELAAQGIKLDLAYIRKLAADEAGYAKTLKSLELVEGQLKQFRQERLTLIARRRGLRSRISAARVAYGKTATAALRGSLGDLQVAVKFAPDALSPEAEEIIQKAMNWRTSQVPRAAMIVESITVPRLIDLLRRQDPKPLTELRSSDGAQPFSLADAREIISQLRQEHLLFQLERCEINDRPRIAVTKQVVVGGKTQQITRDFAKLSLGQQQSVLLALMLSSSSSAPLIIDQPEDNLDGEFIFHSLVPVLRAAKERRQIIVVTHNANIAVLGDAEQIVALKSTSDRSSIVARGSIDDPTTRKVTCQILEGAEEAFRRRARIYGI
jgi:energy-coupling factor transporter ATP-binding protein EcfA2